MITFLTREVVPRVQSKVKGDLLKGCERGAGRAETSRRWERAEIAGVLWGAWWGQARATWSSSPRVLGGQ